MNETDLITAVAEFYPQKTVSQARFIGDRIIIEIKNHKEIPSLTTKLKNKLSQLLPDKKISVIFVEDKNTSIGIQAIEKWQIRNVKHIIAVASGKGGVGKSTTAVNLALAFEALGQKTALADADIYGPSVPTMLGYEGQPMLSSDGKKFMPFSAWNIQSVSIGSLIEKNTPLIWRGVKAAGALEQLLTQTDWAETDIMVIDMPPGTGDIQITLAQRVALAGAVIVSTPQDIALIDAVKGVNMFKKTGTPILGLIENMSYYICPHCSKRSYIFGRDGVKKIAESINEPFLGEIPLDMLIRENADNGTPVAAKKSNDPYAVAYKNIARKILERIG